jgi:N-carbamoyl-L-amino-acid hydrolase
LPNIEIDPNRLMGELETLAGYSDAPAPAVTRVVFSPVDRQARLYVKTLFAAAGLDVREDAVGNTFARWQGSDPSLPAVGTGSHIDAIPHAGRYDGTVGVLGGLEAIRALQQGGFRPRRSIELLLFTSEEPTRYGIGCLGSRLLARTLDPAAAAQLRDRDGKTMDELRHEAGFGGSLADVPLPPGYYATFIELHIEQGPVLEQGNTDLGVVTSIAAPASLRIFFEGEGGHAGAVLMPGRRDAFLAAAEVALAVERLAKSTGAIDTVGTVGVCEVFPGAINSIPSRTRLEVDIRDIDQARRNGVLTALRQTWEEIAARRQVKITHEVINADAPAQSNEAAVDALVRACESQGRSYQRMVSRAYHDSLFMSRVAPVAMLFIPCRNGVSHRPEEYAKPEDIAQGTAVLAQALAMLAE